MNQVSVVITEKELGLSQTDLPALRALVRQLPSEPSLVILAKLVARAENARSPAAQVRLAREFFGATALFDAYHRASARSRAPASVFAPQALYSLIRLIVEEARDVPFGTAISARENRLLGRAVVAVNSVTERFAKSNGRPSRDDILAFELQIGNYSSRPRWMEEIARQWVIHHLASEDPVLASSKQFVPVEAWLKEGSAGFGARDQILLGFAMSAGTNAWDAEGPPVMLMDQFDDILATLGMTDRRGAALGLISQDRETLQASLEHLDPGGDHLLWETRPFKQAPFLRLREDQGLLLLGRPWVHSWLFEGLHYRTLAAAQRMDSSETDGATNHVRRFTGFTGEVFERYCLDLAVRSESAPSRVTGDQQYGKGGGKSTSDVAIRIGTTLVLFEMNARRIAAQPLISGDPADAAREIATLLNRKIDQLGAVIRDVLGGEAKILGLDPADIERIIPVVVSGGRLWQTPTLWAHVDESGDDEKRASFQDPRVSSVQALDPAEYEHLLALSYAGADLAELLASKAAGPWRTRDLAAWLEEAKPVANYHVRLPEIQAAFDEIVAELDGAIARVAGKAPESGARQVSDPPTPAGVRAGGDRAAVGPRSGHGRSPR